MFEFTVILVSLLFSAFFSGMEIAFVTSSRLRVEMLKRRKEFPWQILDLFARTPERYIATMLVGNNIALVIYGIFMGEVLTAPLAAMSVGEWRPFAGELSGLLMQTVVSTLVILITAEFLPKTLFRLDPNGALRVFALPVLLFYWLFTPITRLSIFLSNVFLIKLLRSPIVPKSSPVFSKVDLDAFLTEMSQTRSDSANESPIKIFQNALDFSDTKVRECYVPRTELKALEVNDSIEHLRDVFVATGFSKILIYEGSIDKVVGYFHSASLFSKPKTIRSCLKELPFVPETMSVRKLLGRFIAEQKSIALVVDEFGGTAGIITIEDIMEEIFGEIEDEHDKTQLVDQEEAPGVFVLSARLEIDYLNGKYKLDLHETDEFETLAGLILHEHQNLPEKGEVILTERFRFTILEVSQNRIELVRLEKLAD